MLNRKIAIFILALVCLSGAGLLSLYPSLPLYTPKILIGLALILGVIYFSSSGRGRVKVNEGFSGLASRDSIPLVSFDDVAANAEAVRSLKEIAKYISDPKKFTRLGARMPRGVMLYGPPGTGKTLLAKALANEAGVPIFAMSGSDFVQMYAGVGASRVRALFKKARKCGKCVIFIDEIDAVGKKRRDESSDERDQTLNALLSEMSGFDSDSGTLVVAATNRIDTLDDALLRPGRFDRLIEVGLPTRDERLDILRLHLKNKRARADIDIETLAAQTVTFSGASLESMINEAAIGAASRGADEIAPEDMEKAFISTVAGTDKKSAASKKELTVIALHEAGHALASRLELPDDRVTRVTILPTSKGMAGYSMSVPVETSVVNKSRLLCQIEVLLAGRAAEMLIGGEDCATSGAMNDLCKAGELAGAMVMDLGMSESPCVSLRQIGKSTGVSSPDAFSLCKELLQRQFDKVTKLLSDNSTTLMAICEALLQHETINESELDAIING